MARYEQLASWSQCDQRLRDQRYLGQEVELIPGQDRRQDELRFGERKLIADTHARASPKGEVRKAMAPGCARRLEALWVEDIRLLPEVRMPVGRRRKHQDIRPFGNAIAANLILGDSITGKGPCLRIEAHNYLNDQTLKFKPGQS